MISEEVQADFSGHISNKNTLNQNHDYNKLVKLFHFEADTEYTRMRNVRSRRDAEKEKRRMFK